MQNASGVLIVNTNPRVNKAPVNFSRFIELAFDMYSFASGPASSRSCFRASECPGRSFNFYRVKRVVASQPHPTPLVETEWSSRCFPLNGSEILGEK